MSVELKAYEQAALDKFMMDLLNKYIRLEHEVEWLLDGSRTVNVTMWFDPGDGSSRRKLCSGIIDLQPTAPPRAGLNGHVTATQRPA